MSWVEIPDPEKTKHLLSRCYSSSESESGYPMVAMDIFGDYLEYNYHFFYAESEESGWVDSSNSPEGLEKEFDEMCAIVKKKAEVRHGIESDTMV